MKLRSPAAARNVGPIGDVLAEWLPAGGLVLEVASGSGEHALAFARRFPDLDWQPSDPDAAALASTAQWRAEEGPRNLLPPVRLDVAEREWPVVTAKAVLSINIVHISPWEASLGLLAGAAQLLAAGGPLILYGPWIVDGEETAPSNLLFDADLKRRSPSWGLRRVAVFAEEAAKRGLTLEAERAMPANNRMLLFRSATG
ncbi:DUF938 domain-containing protein [uncultured Sphingomonas sp.]|uniref:DUF938 domain-containing protein n=1 Tax=uncultured Sphingomonas sp. TaxID=158754 RepID=UPI0025E2CC7E|nr:DUF938 domain-containing protein [uncultured Sphingomonas sp.]